MAIRPSQFLVFGTSWAVHAMLIDDQDAILRLKSVKALRRLKDVSVLFFREPVDSESKS